MSASNPFNGRRGRRSGTATRDPRQAARELVAWLEETQGRENDWNNADEPEEAPARPSRRRAAYDDHDDFEKRSARPRRAPSKSLSAILDRLEESHAEKNDAMDYEQLATILEKFQKRIEAVEESSERERLKARKEKAEGAITSRMASSLNAMKDRLEILQEKSFERDAYGNPAAERKSVPPAPEPPPAESEAQAALRAQLAKLEQRFSGLARARAEAALAASRSERLPGALHTSAAHHTEKSLAQIEERLDVLNESITNAMQQPLPVQAPPRARIQPPAAVNTNYLNLAAPTNWAAEAQSYPDFHAAPQPAPMPAAPIPVPQPAPAVAPAPTTVFVERRAHPPAPPPIDLSILTGMEQTLAEMERRLRDMAPGSAVANISHELQSVRDRLDRLAQHEPDMRGLDDVRAGTQEIRNALGRLPSTESFAKLARDVQVIAGKLDHFAHEAARNGNPMPALAPMLNNAVGTLHDSLGRLEKQMERRFENIARNQQGVLEQTAGTLHASVKHFDDSITALQAKIDERVGAIADNNTTPLRLNAIEHNLSALFRKLEEQRAEASEFNRKRDEEAALRLDQHLEGLGKQLDYTRKNVADITTASAEHLLKATASTLERNAEQLKQHTLSALDSVVDRVTHAAQGAVERVSGNSSEGLNRVTLATTAALEKIAANTTRQISTLEIAVREIGSRLDRLKNESPAVSVLDNLRSDIQELSGYLGRLPASGASQNGLSHIQSSVDELLGRVDVLSRTRTTDNAADMLRNTVSDIAAQVVQSVRDQLNDTSITVRAQLNDTSFHALQRSLDNLGERIEQRGDAHNSRLLDAVQKSINGLGVRLDQISRSAPENVAISTIQTAIENLAERLERAESAGHLNATATINNAINELAERLKHTDAKLGGIASLEKGLSTLLQEMSATRHSTLQASEAVAAKVVRDVLAGQAEPKNNHEGQVSALALTMAELKADAARSEQRTNDQLNAVRALVEKFVTQPSMPFATPAEAHAQAVQTETAPAPTASPADLARAAARKAMAEAREAGHFAPVADIKTPAVTPSKAPAVEPQIHFKGFENPANLQPALAMPDDEPEDILDLVNEHANTRSRFIAAARRSMGHGYPINNDSLSAVEAALDPANTNETSAAQEAFERARQFAAQGFSTPARRKSMMVGLAASLLLLGSYQVAQHALDASTVDGRETIAAARNAPANSFDTASLPPAADKPVRTVETSPVFPDGTAAAPDSMSALVESSQATPLPQPNPQTLAATPSDQLVTGSLPNLEPLAIPEPLPPAIGSPRLRTRAFAGDSAAQYEVATRYSEGRGVARNSKAAAAWYERAARQGLAPAQYRLGSIYEKGSGISKDLNQAKFWYEKAAAGGNARAMHNLGVLHAEGGLGTPDFKQAAEWFRQAADRGVKDSQFNYAILLVRGLGVKQDLAESYVWLALVADQGDRDAASKRDQLAAKLDPQSLAAARQKVQNWQAVPLDELANEVTPPPGGWDESLASSSKNAPVRR